MITEFRKYLLSDFFVNTVLSTLFYERNEIMFLWPKYTVFTFMLLLNLSGIIIGVGFVRMDGNH